jgi:Cation transporting ATPase, C-terminus
MVTRNPYVWMATAFCTSILLTAVYWPPLAEPLHLVAPSRTGWGVILALSLAPLIPIQLGMMIAAALRSHQANPEATA